MPDISYTSLILLKEVNIMKKAQGLPLNTIVIAALVLLVLVILALILTGKLGNFAAKTNECLTNGGTCDSDTVCKAGAEGFIGHLNCENNKNCCIGIPLAPK